MSDLLSGQAIADTFDPPLTDDEYNAVIEALDKAREALLNPTDEQVRDIARYWLNEHYQTYDTITGQLKCMCGDTGDRDLHRIRVTLAVAGGDE